MGSPASPSPSFGPADDEAAGERLRPILEAAQLPHETVNGELPDGNQFGPGQLRTWLEAIKNELGDNPELIRQALADVNAQHRQDARSYFEARLEYARQQAEANQGRMQGIREYGLQTLKWAFILNAGAIALVLAYVGGAIGKSPSTDFHLSSFGPLLMALWPFVLGCVLILLSGVCGFLNFSYADLSSASAETLHIFLDPKTAAWPAARFQNAGEGQLEFHRRFGWKVNATRRVAIAFATASGVSFIYGVYRVLHTVLV
jgi:hypothetical protein